MCNCLSGFIFISFSSYCIHVILIENILYSFTPESKQFSGLFSLDSFVMLSCYLILQSQCIFGKCEINATTTTSSTTSTVSSTTSTEPTSSTTTDSDLQTTTTTAVTERTAPTATTPSTTTPEDCVVETGFVEFDLPGKKITSNLLF